MEGRWIDQRQYSPRYIEVPANQYAHALSSALTYSERDPDGLSHISLRGPMSATHNIPQDFCRSQGIRSDLVCGLVLQAVCELRGFCPTPSMLLRRQSTPQRRQFMALWDNYACANLSVCSIFASGTTPAPNFSVLHLPPRCT